MAIFLEVLDYYSNCEKGWEKKSGSQYTSRLFLELNLSLSSPQKMLCPPLCRLKAATLGWLLTRPPDDKRGFRALVTLLLVQLFILGTSWMWEGRGGKGQIGNMDNSDIFFTLPSETWTICAESDILVTALKPRSSQCDRSRDSHETSCIRGIREVNK